jgi:nucleoid-associated protein YgaU
MAKQHSELPEYKDLVMIKLRDKFYYAVIGMITVIFLCIGILSFMQKLIRKPTPRITIEAQKPQQKAAAKNVQNEPKKYTVKDGDYLWQIAQTTYGDGNLAIQIAKANNIDPNAPLVTGQQLILPTIGNLQPSPTQPAGDISAISTQQVTFSGNEYTVQDGESLSDIALKAYGDSNMWTRIVQANNLQNPNSVSAGTKLKIPRN